MMTKNNSGKFFALKLCGLLPAIALPVALFGLTTAEFASPVNPEPSITITDTTKVVSITIQDVDSAEKAISVTMKSGETIAFDATDTQAFSLLNPDDISLITIQKDTTKTKEGKIHLVVEEEKVHLLGSVDVDPEFPGGQNAMMKFIYDNLRYPKEAADKKIQGRVTVAFVIKSDGNVDYIKVQKGVDPLLDAEAERVVKAMPAWTPGKYKGSIVAVRFFLPIVFQLSKDKAAETE